jgi:hypothetical protein
MSSSETRQLDTRRLAKLLDQQEIRDVCYRYCRGIDRRQFDLVRSCYHPDATDDHGDYKGGVDGFIDYVTVGLRRWVSTNHFLGNMLIEPRADQARVETYAIAFHRFAARAERPERDFIAGIRYVDDFERRDGEWRIATRVCVVDWTRSDEVSHPIVIGDEHVRGRTDRDDPVFAPRLADLFPGGAVASALGSS